MFVNRRGDRRRGPALLRLLVAVLAGLALWLSFPGHDLWWLAPLSCAALLLVLLRSTWRGGILVGLLYGWAFFVPTLSWSGTYVGKLPWFALATLQALYFAAMGLVVAIVGGRLLRARRPYAALLVGPVAWVVQEWARATTPYGGFPWARLAFSQADSPLVRFAAYGGAPGLTLVTALVGSAVAGLVLAAYGRRVVPALSAVAVAVVVLGGCALIPLPTNGVRATVALIQGNVPTAGLEFNAQRRAVLDNHVKGTLALAANRPSDLSLVIWPENSSDIDPTQNADANSEIRDAVAQVKAPIILGAVLAQPWPSLSNASMLYRTPDATPEVYIKQHPVPFAEYIPDKDFYRHFSKEVDLVPHPFVAGHARGQFLLDSPVGQFWALPTICFEVAYDGLIRDAVTHTTDHPSLLVVQTNNATFGYTDESVQQFAISRIRAVEHGRSVAHVSTVGVSGFVNPDGTTGRISSLFTPDQMVGHPVLRSGLTVADRIGPWQNYAPTLVLLLLAVTAIGRARPARVETSSPLLEKESVT